MIEIYVLLCVDCHWGSEIDCGIERIEDGGWSQDMSKAVIDFRFKNQVDPAWLRIISFVKRIMDQGVKGLQAPPVSAYFDLRFRKERGGL
jgi:hypothetical protein